MTTAQKSSFEILAAIDVSKQCEKKNGFTYLSWAWAVDSLLRADPKANWSYGEPMRFGDTVMVYCTVTAFGKPMTMQLPVIDFRNKPIANPTAMDVNTAMMRCLVKGIALHGLGLYIYAGEDIPKEDTHKPTKSTPAEVWDTMTPEKQSELQGVVDTVRGLLESDMALAVGCFNDITDADERTAAWSRFDSKERSAMKKYADANKP